MAAKAPDGSSRMTAAESEKHLSILFKLLFYTFFNSLPTANQLLAIATIKLFLFAP